MCFISNMDHPRSPARSRSSVKRRSFRSGGFSTEAGKEISFPSSEMWFAAEAEGAVEARADVVAAVESQRNSQCRAQTR